MEKINLVEAISYVTGNNRNFTMDQRILKYFIEKDLTEIFGDEKPYLDETINCEIRENTHTNMKINIQGCEYILEYKDGVLSLKSDQAPNRFKICEKNGVMSNQVVSTKEDTIVLETQNVSLGKLEFYDYQKSVTNRDGYRVEYPYYRLKAAQIKLNGKAYFELYNLSNPTKEYNSVLQKIVNSLKQGNLYTVNIGNEIDAINYLDQIYEILENQTQEKEVIRK